MHRKNDGIHNTLVLTTDHMLFIVYSILNQIMCVTENGHRRPNMNLSTKALNWTKTKYLDRSEMFRSKNPTVTAHKPQNSTFDSFHIFASRPDSFVLKRYNCGSESIMSASHLPWLCATWSFRFCCCCFCRCTLRAIAGGECIAYKLPNARCTRTNQTTGVAVRQYVVRMLKRRNNSPIRRKPVYCFAAKISCFLHSACSFMKRKIENEFDSNE